MEIVFDCSKLEDIPQILVLGLAEYVWRKNENCLLIQKFTQGRVKSRPRKVIKGEMKRFLKLLFQVMHKGAIMHGERRHEATYRDMGLMNALEQVEHINLPTLMIKHMSRITDPKPCPHLLAYGDLLTIVVNAYNVPLGENNKATKKDMIDRNTLAAYRSLLWST